MRPATTSWRSEASRYRAERLGAWPFAPLVVGLWAAGVLASPELPRLTHLFRLVAMALLVCGFRLFHDLADLPAGRLRRPDRVLSRSARPAAFWRGLGALGALQVVALAALEHPSARLGALAGLWAALGAVYAWKRRRGLNPLLSAHLVLLKYPAFVALTWPPAAGEAAVAAARPAMLFVYLFMMAWELATDAEVRAAARRPAALFQECLLLLLCLFLLRGPWL